MCINKYIDYLNFEKAYSKHTLIAYRKDLELFQLFLKANYQSTPLLDVSYRHVRDWIVFLVNNHLENQSINRKMSALKSFYAFYEKVGDITMSPMQGHKALKTPKRIAIPFSKKELQEVNAFFENADSFEACRDYVIIELLYTTGIRRAELINLEISSVNFDNKAIKVLGKRNKERYIPILSNTVLVLKKYLDYRRELETDSEYLLVTKKGNPIYPSLVYKVVNKVLSFVSTKNKKSPHILRHTFATHLLDQGADLTAVKDLLGHVSLASTQIYTQTSLSQLKKVYKKAHPRNKN